MARRDPRRDRPRHNERDQLPARAARMGGRARAPRRARAARAPPALVRRGPLPPEPAAPAHGAERGALLRMSADDGDPGARAASAPDGPDAQRRAERVVEKMRA